MISRLEKLLLGITAALTFGCGEEAVEQCREGREWNGRECVQASNDYGRDVENDTAAEEPGPECYTHQECGESYLCVEGDCESIEEACAPNPDFNGCGAFEGLYEFVGCMPAIAGENPSHLYFHPVSDCGVIVIMLENIDDDVPSCFNGQNGYTRTPEGNTLIFPQEGEPLILCSNINTITNYASCLMEKVQNPPDLSGFIEHCLYL